MDPLANVYLDNYPMGEHRYGIKIVLLEAGPLLTRELHSQYPLDDKYKSHRIVISYLFLSSMEGHIILPIQAKSYVILGKVSSNNQFKLNFIRITLYL